MDTSPLKSASGASEAMLAAKANLQEVKETTQQFEAIFLRQFIGQALKPLLHDTLGSQVAGAGIYQQMVTDTIAEKLAQGGEFGFSSMLQSQLIEKAPGSDTKDTSND